MKWICDICHEPIENENDIKTEMHEDNLVITHKGCLRVNSYVVAKEKNVPKYKKVALSSEEHDGIIENNIIGEINE